MQRRGLTLVQLLVIVVALVMIAAVLFPVFVPRPRRNYCQSNLKQIMLGMKEYVQDYNSKFPLVVIPYDASVPKRAYGWADAVDPYLKSHQVFYCPTKTKRPRSDDPMTGGYVDYWYNRNLGTSELASYFETNQS